MTAAPFLASLLREALPEEAVLDLGEPSGQVFPWFPGARCGVAAPDALPVAELALLRRFRQGRDGLPVFGLDAAADSALLAGAPDAAGAAGAPLLVLDGPPPASVAPLLEAGAKLLRNGPAEGEAPPPGPERGRIMLLGGSVSRIERWDLLVPPDQVTPVFDRLHVAAHRLAATLGGPGRWQVGGRVVLPQLASLGMLALGSERLPALALPAAGLLHDLPGLVEDEVLPFGPASRVRLLLGRLPALPATLRLRLRGIVPAGAPALFLDGQRLAQAQCRAEAEETVLEARLVLRSDRATVIGLALPDGAPAGAGILGLGLAP